MSRGTYTAREGHEGQPVTRIRPAGAKGKPASSVKPLRNWHAHAQGRCSHAQKLNLRPGEREGLGGG